MSMGPVTLFDKSTLQSLSVDESVWFNNFYRGSITPLFFIETLADLEKGVAAGRTPEGVVGNLALKTPVLGAAPNVHHSTICLGELLGHKVEMRHVPVISGGRSIKAADREGLYFDQPREMDALARWQRGDFLGLERDFARHWRADLSELDLRADLRALGLHSVKLRSLAEAKSLAEERIRADGRRYATLKAALAVLRIPNEYRPRILTRWKALGAAHSWDRS